MYLMGIDVGTTGVKALLITEEGEFVTESTNSYPLLSPRPGWFEQNPEDWWEATLKSIRQMLKESEVDTQQIACVGLSGQYHGLVLIDERHEVLRPAILWNDQRTAKQADNIIQKAGRENLMRIACTNGAPYFTACKLWWVRENNPEIYERVYKLMLPKDYIRFKLTGEFATDVTDASGTLFLDIRNRKWSKELVDILDVDRAILPELVESPEVSGKITRAMAEITGLPPGIPVVGGAGDQAAAAVGNGIVEEGLVTYSIGTSGVIYAATDEIRTDPDGRVNTFCHAVPGKWCLLSCINSAAGSLQWFQEKFADWERREAEEQGKDVYAILEEKASAAPIGSDNLFFLPYLAGERHPHTDTNARGVFFGFHHGHCKSHTVRSILEGVAYSFRDCLEVMKELGVSIREIRATGGGAKSELWMNIQVNVSGESIATMAADEGGAAYGAAILGSVGAGIYGSVHDACSRLVKRDKLIVPEKEMKEKYERYFRFFQTLYPLLKNSYERLAELG